MGAKVGPHPEDKDGCCPEGHTLETDADCLPPCDPDQTSNCVDVCKGVKCPSGKYCLKGRCIDFPDVPDGGLGGDGGIGLSGVLVGAAPVGEDAHAADTSEALAFAEQVVAVVTDAVE